MPDIRASAILFVDDEPLGRRVAEVLRRATCRVTPVGALTDAPPLAESEAAAGCDLAVVAMTTAAPANRDRVRRLVQRLRDVPVLVVVGDRGDAAPLPIDARATVVSGHDEEGMLSALEGLVPSSTRPSFDQRLVWELQIINQISSVIARSLEVEGVLTGALQCLVPALGAAAGGVRLRNEITGAFDTASVLGSGQAVRMWERHPAIARPSTEVIATRRAVLVEDFAAGIDPREGASLPIRSALSVPLVASDELLGTLSLGAARPHRFDVADERLLMLVAAQLAVAVQNTRLHQRIRRGKREWEQTFDAISDPIAVYDGHGVLLRGNVSLAALLERPVTSITRATCGDVGFCGGECPACAVTRALLTGTSIRSEVTRADGQIFSVTTFPVSAGGDGPSVVQVAKNVTEEIRSARRLQRMSDELTRANARLTATVEQLKSTQAQLLQAEKLSAIGQLVAGVAHELNNPLTSVIGYAQLLQEEIVDARGGLPRGGAGLAHDLQRIADESERAARIVRNLLAFARRQTAARSPQDVAELTGRVLALRAYELRLESIELTTEIDADLPAVIADGSQIQQALLNLILNAEQAMRGRDTRRLTVRAAVDPIAGAVAVSVADTGHGIDPVTLTRIFDPFFTTREVGGGTGLGLSICYGIIRDHGGQILVESEENAGTTFTLLLPVHMPGERVPAEPVLVVHGDQGERDYLTAALQAWGYQTESIADGVAALARLRTSRIQALLVDQAAIAGDLSEWNAEPGGEAPVPLILLAEPGEREPIARFGRERASAVLSPPFELRPLRAAMKTIAKEYV
jgi:two-component system NtrC family sensor kinase